MMLVMMIRRVCHLVNMRGKKDTAGSRVREGVLIALLVGPQVCGEFVFHECATAGLFCTSSLTI